MNEGFTIRHIPAQEIKVCHGCKWLNTTPMLFGHDRVTKNYNCLHPDIEPIQYLYGAEGRMIYYNHEGDCITPSWCPYLNTKTKEEQ